VVKNINITYNGGGGLVVKPIIIITYNGSGGPVVKPILIT
jgi:hypothetical protein